MGSEENFFGPPSQREENFFEAEGCPNNGVGHTEGWVLQPTAEEEAEEERLQ